MVKRTGKKNRKNRRQIEREVRYFWGGVLLVGLMGILLMYIAMM
ncbi:hypothetical protein [Microbulbifer litoralis]|nr:hypothetical protein [Microbulbifer sp. GX H0434]